MKYRNLFLLIMLCFSFKSEVAGEILPEKGCKENPAVVDKCFTIHGRLSIYNGTPGVRIWQVGTKRMFGVVPSEDEIMPAPIKKHISPDSRIFGDFLICPFTKEKVGVMRYVCIDSANNLIVEKYIEGKDKPVTFKIPGEELRK
jgi:hypothetical protein